MPEHDSRAGQLNAVITPKILFLAKLAARSKCLSIAQFTEYAYMLALSPEGMDEGEPSYGRGVKPTPGAQLEFEDLWDEDEVTRLFKVGLSNEQLLVPRQLEVFNHVVHSLIKQGKKITLKTCVGFAKLQERR
jgi:hypothetical protein